MLVQEASDIIRKQKDITYLNDPYKSSKKRADEV